MVQGVKDIIKRIERTISRFNMLDYGDRVLVAVSGGPDSVVLLDVLNRLKDALSLTLVVAHFNHGLRPRDDAAETRFTATLADAMDLPFVTEKALTPPGGNGMSLEEEARDLRYEFLHGAKTAHGAQKIALGHTLDDQAETVLMRLLRGSGIRGLSGIPPVRHPDIIRPLIEVTRREIEGYLVHRNLKHITDPSNLEKQHFRNRIRLELLPQLKTYQPEIVRILGQTAEIMRNEDRWMEKEAMGWIEGAVTVSETGDQSLPLEAFAKLAPALQSRVIRRIISRLLGGLRRIHLRHIDAVKSLTRGRPQKRLNLPNGIRVIRTYDTLLFTQQSEKKHKGFHITLGGPGVFSIDAVPCTVTIEELETKKTIPEIKDLSPWIAHLDGDRITYPLVMRCFAPGDRFVPLGMTGHKKLKDFFVDQKIPIHVRKRIPLLCRGEDLVWVCGLRLDERFKVRPETKRTVRVTLALSSRPLRDFLFNSPVTLS